MLQRRTLTRDTATVDKLNKLPSTKGTKPGKIRISNATAAAATELQTRKLHADEAANTFVDV